MTERLLKFHRKVDVAVGGDAYFGQTGPATESMQVLVDEHQFFKMTGIRASAPARVALLRLLREDVTSASLKLLWKDELRFEEPHFQLTVLDWIPLLAVTLMILFGASVIGLIVGAQGVVDHAATAIFMIIALISGAALLVTLIELYRPYVVAKRITPIVARVNLELPLLLTSWRKGGARSSGGS